ncbi:hypothetical protein P7D22_06655 [Lichenihabitans sp. Uapishka_5]|uniref:DsrE family protein n=1 Tax=Lichenihabitans sp. Uapishka_5 TaxID=3037302 RepID=UPI0029E80CDA|nr:hypothetical protein [Lichenihabitans sp. Uapishka_5]MDX7950857.1 hypothetical protein [Lichenihabitans sp. Uapishka_5]
MAGTVAALVLPWAAAGASAQPTAATHRIVILIDSDDDAIMRHAISYAVNLTHAYAERHDLAEIEVVANGAGIKLLRGDTSPLRQPLEALHSALPHLVLSMCASSRRIAEQKEGHSIPLIDGARLVPFGIARVIDLEEAGWSYVHG